MAKRRNGIGGDDGTGCGFNLTAELTSTRRTYPPIDHHHRRVVSTPHRLR